MDLYFDIAATELLGLLGSIRSEQLRLLTGDPTILRAILRGSRFEVMEDRLLNSVVAAAVAKLQASPG